MAKSLGIVNWKMSVLAFVFCLIKWWMPKYKCLLASLGLASDNRDPDHSEWIADRSKAGKYLAQKRLACPKTYKK